MALTRGTSENDGTSSLSMPEHIYGIEHIEERTGLPRKYLDRCSSQLRRALDPHRIQGEKNKYFYNDNGLVLFDRIKQLKEGGYTLANIAETLESDRASTVENSRQTLESEQRNSTGNGFNEKLLNALTDSYKDTIKAKEETIGELRKQLQFLTDGRSPDEIRAERERRHQSLKHRRELLDEWDSLKGKWFVGKRRREIIEKLKQLQL